MILTGILKTQYTDNWLHTYLVQSDGLMIDLVFRLQEIKVSYPNKNCQAFCYISNDDLVIDNRLYYGAIEARYETYHDGYDLFHNTTLSIGRESLSIF